MGQDQGYGHGYGHGQVMVRSTYISKSKVGPELYTKIVFLSKITDVKALGKSHEDKCKM